MKIVLDTNVLVSGMLFAGPPHEILRAWSDRRCGRRVVLSWVAAVACAAEAILLGRENRDPTSTPWSRGGNVESDGDGPSRFPDGGPHTSRAPLHTRLSDRIGPRAAYFWLPAIDFSLTQAASRAFLSASDPPGSEPPRMKPCPAPS